MNIQEFLGRIEGVKSVGGGQWRGNCPACDDHHGHLYIAENEGTILLDCKHGCTAKDIVGRLGLELKDLYPERREDRVIREHMYTDILKKAILRKVGGGKVGLWMARVNGQWVKGQQGMTAHPYHAERLKDAQVIYLVEGEKDVENMEALGYVATSLPNGCKSKWRPKVDIPYFADKDVIVITDNDESGEIYGDKAVEALLCVAASIRRVPSSRIMATVPEKGDISDIISMVGADRTKELLQAAVDATPYERPPKPAEPRPVNTDTLAYKRLTTDIDATKYEHNDIENARLFCDIYQGVCRWSPTVKGWAVYKDGKWQEDQGNVAAQGFIEEMFDALHAISSDKGSRFIANVAQLAQHNVRERVLKDAQNNGSFRWDELDRDPQVFNCKNGTLDLRTGDLHPHDPNDMISKAANVDYVPGAVSQDWIKFIDDVMQGDAEKTRYLQKALGLALTGIIREECFFVLYGKETRNGKSTLVETFAHMLGDYAQNVDIDLFAVHRYKDAEKPSPMLAAVAGKRFVYTSEPERGMSLDAALIKRFTGGDALTARQLQQRVFTFVPQCKLFIHTNYLPNINDKTLFTSQRVKVIEFNRHFEAHEQNKRLKEILRSETNKSGILNWAIEGYKLYQAEGLGEPSVIDGAVADYMLKMDKVAQFFEECMINEGFGGVKGADVYEAFKVWCRECNLSPLSKQNFFVELRAKALMTETGTLEGKTVRNFVPGYIIDPDIKVVIK